MRGFLSLAWLLPTALALPYSASSNKAIYFIQNESSGDKIVAMPVYSNGSLGNPVLTATNGTGANPISTLATAAGIFFSQSSITTGGNYLFAVNSGSNSLSMFNVSAENPTNLTLVSTVDSMGNFPTSVTYSEVLQQACVLHGGSKGGVSCFNVNATTGLTANGSLRPLNSGFNQTKVPTGPVDTVTQIVFDPASTALYVVIKGNPASKPISPGVFLSYAINGTDIATKPTVSQVDDIILNFGANFISESRFLIAAPTIGGAIVRITNGTFNQTSKIVVKEQRAICWSAWSEELNYGYLYDAGRTTVVVVDGSNGEMLEPIIASTPSNNGTQGGLYDTAIVDLYSYSLADPDGVVAINLRTGKQIQYFDLSPYGNRTDFKGMAGWSSSYGYY